MSIRLLTAQQTHQAVAATGTAEEEEEDSEEEERRLNTTLAPEINSDALSFGWFLRLVPESPNAAAATEDIVWRVHDHVGR